MRSRLLPALLTFALAGVLAHAQVVKIPRPAPQKTTPKTAAKSAQKPTVERTVPFTPGEMLSYDISWASFLTAATATVTVRDKRSSFDSTAYYIVAEGRPTSLVSTLYRLYYKVDTLLDAFTLLPQRGSIYSQEGGRQRLRATRFDHTKPEARYEVQAGNPLKTETDLTFDVPSGLHDPLSAIYVLRTLDMSPKTRTVIPVILNGTIYRVQITVSGPETVTSGLGTRSAWKLTPVVLDPSDQGNGGRFAVWISNDARRLPLAIEAELPVGLFRLTLRRVDGL